MLARLSGAVLVAALAASSAHAYLGLSIGPAKYRNACQGAGAGVSCDSSDTGFRLFAGHAFTPHFAAEAGVNLLGTVGASTGESADLTAADLSALGSWPIGNRLAVHARLGAYYGDLSTPSGENVPVFSPPPLAPPRAGWASGNTTGMTYGLGLSYGLTETATLRLEWQRFKGFAGSSGPQFDVDLFSIGALAHF